MKTQPLSLHGDTARIVPEHAQEKHTPVVTQLWHRVALGAILLISAFLNFYELQKVGYGNTYYTAAVKSMLTSWHNFFFVSFDAGGFVSVDKPPLGLWIQTASAKLFGFSGLSVILPEAIAGVFSVALLYYLIRRVFGPTTGLTAALILAIAPVSIAANRDNIVDSLLVFTVLLGAWAITKAVETGSLRWLLLCAVVLGLAFNIKTLAAYLVVPAFGLVYLLGAPLSWRTRILHLALAVVLLLVISFAWIVTVDLTPASQRPYVGSSQTNSELNLTFGYNGVQRVLGTAIGGGNLPSGSSSQKLPLIGGPGGGGNGFFSSSGTGGASVFRLFAQDVAGQISWLLPLALLGLLVAIWRSWRKAPSRLPKNQQQHAIVLWGGWLLIMVIYFSIAGAEHSYYLTMLAPGIAATTGIGITALWSEYRSSSWLGWLLPVALVVTAGVQAYILSAYPSWSAWMTPLILALSLVTAALLVLTRLIPRWSTRLITHPALLVSMLALLVAPSVWSAITTQNAGGLVPVAGPSSNSSLALAGGILGNGDPMIERFLLANQGQARFLVATPSATTASSLILDTGKAVMAWGGFTGTDPILTTKQLALMVAKGDVRFFLTMKMPGNTDFTIDEIPEQIRAEIPPQVLEQLEKGDFSFGGFGGSNNNSNLTTWITAHCSIVPTSRWQSSTASSSTPPVGGGQQLYDCASHS